MILKKVLQSYSVFRQVSVVATTIIRDSSQRVLRWNNADLRHFLSCYVLVLMSTAVSISVELGNRWVCGGVEIVEQ